MDRAGLLQQSVTYAMTYDAKVYWTKRHERMGDLYPARGGRPESDAEQREFVAGLLHHLPTGKVLDFGCGPQRFREMLESHGLEYHGHDIVDGLSTPDVTAEAEFDCVIATWVLQHIVDPSTYADTIEGIHELLRDGGVLLVVDSTPIEDPAAHMQPRGPYELQRLFGVWQITEYRHDWVGVFTK